MVMLDEKQGGDKHKSQDVVVPAENGGCDQKDTV